MPSSNVEHKKIGNAALNVEINRPVTIRSEEAPTRALMNSKSAVDHKTHLLNFESMSLRLQTRMIERKTRGESYRAIRLLSDKSRCSRNAFRCNKTKQNWPIERKHTESKTESKTMQGKHNTKGKTAKANRSSDMTESFPILGFDKKNPGRLLKLGETTEMLPRQAPQMFQKPKLRMDSSEKNTESL
ncbi:hypothetical protein V1477_007695 [Vespula maculifrons]|uniref:Uncharacterized protein n=1 Tax=Vespula maculifrons TaxID=7453 RepID=A0ABD2CGG7_VESMC